MNALDLLIVLVLILAAVGGYRLGFLTRLLSWVGLIVGFLVALAVLPALMERVDDGSETTAFVLAVATIMGCLLIGQGVGLALGSRLQIALPREGPSRQIDQSAGAFLGPLGVLILVGWFVPPMMADYQATAALTRESTVVEWADAWTPDPPAAVGELRALFSDNMSHVFGNLDRSADAAGPPPAASGIPDGVNENVVRSVVKVQGVACRRIQEGSGWVVGPNLIVTNAHVVAGERETEVQLWDQSTRDAIVVAYDAGRDLAVLHVQDLGLEPLATRPAEAGDTGAVYGFPGGGGLDPSPFSVSEIINATGTDIYDRQRSQRRVLVLASNLAPGDSGAAIVDPQGQVIGVAFAIAPDRSGVAYALDMSELDAVMAENNLATPQDTDSCLA